MHHHTRTSITAPLTHLRLKRTLGYWGATIDGVGVILCAGIYALIGVAAGVAGPALWISFVLAAIIAILTGLSYAELASIFKSDAGEYDYLRKAFNRGLGLVVSFVLVLAIVVICATVAFAFGGYFHQYAFDMIENYLDSQFYPNSSFGDFFLLQSGISPKRPSNCS